MSQQASERERNIAIIAAAVYYYNHMPKEPVLQPGFEQPERKYAPLVFVKSGWQSRCFPNRAYDLLRRASPSWRNYG